MAACLLCYAIPVILSKVLMTILHGIAIMPDKTANHTINVYTKRDFYNRNHQFISSEWDKLGYDGFIEKYPYLDAALQNPYDRFFVVCEDGNKKIIGYASLSIFSETDLCKETKQVLSQYGNAFSYIAVTGLAVIPEYRGQGYSIEIMQKCVDFVKEHHKEENREIHYLKLSSFSKQGREKLISVVEKISRKNTDVLIEYGFCDIEYLGLYAPGFSPSTELTLEA